MTADSYSVPKRQVPAEVHLAGQPHARVRLFLNERAEAHSGAERPSDLLNGPARFLPVLDAQDKVVLLNSEALMAVTVAVEHEFGGEAPRAEDLAPDQATHARVAVVLQDGTALRGTVAYLMPEAHSRLQDFLNDVDRFVALREERVAHLINKRSITRVIPL